MEPVFMALSHLKQRASASFAEDTKVWILEDDVAVCGPLSNFITEYQQRNADHLSSHYVHVSLPWAHRDDVSRGFHNRYPLVSRWYSFQMVGRFSYKFLTHLESLNRAHNITAVSEMFA